MNLIMELAEKYELQVLEDVSPAFKREYKGRKLGTIDHGRAFVFFPSKNLGVYGEGGLIATNDDQVAEAARMSRAHGGKNYNEMLGYNLRLDALQAAILQVKLSHIDEWNEARRKVARTYNELLKDGSGVVTLYEVPYARHVYHQYVIMRIQNERHDEVQRRLAEAGIGATRYLGIGCLYMKRVQIGTCAKVEQAVKEVLSLWNTCTHLA